MEKKKKLYRTASDLFFLVLACSVGAFSTTAVMIPNGLTSGGLTGIVRILQNFVDIDFSVLYYALAIVIWFVIIALLGIREARKVLLVTVLYPAILMVFEKLNFELLEEKDVILAAIFCGVFAGENATLGVSVSPKQDPACDSRKAEKQEKRCDFLFHDIFSFLTHSTGTQSRCKANRRIRTSAAQDRSSAAR